MSLLPTLKPKRGESTVYHADTDAHWIVTCPFHRGEVAVGYETRTDLETSKPRRAAHVVRRGDEITVEDAEAVFPVYSEETGHEPDCEACSALLAEAAQAIVQVMLDRERASGELMRAVARLRQAADSGDRQAQITLRAIEKGQG